MYPWRTDRKGFLKWINLSGNEKNRMIFVRMLKGQNIICECCGSGEVLHEELLEKDIDNQNAELRQKIFNTFKDREVVQ